MGINNSVSSVVRTVKQSFDFVYTTDSVKSRVQKREGKAHSRS